MKTNFRNPEFALIASVLLALSIGFFSCEKTVDESLPSGNPAGYDDPGYELPPFVNGQSQNDAETGGSNDAAFSFGLDTSKLKTAISPVALKTKPKIFDFTLKLVPCSDGKVSVHVKILTPHLYGYTWKLNNLPAGNGKKLSCVCGHKAQVRVMRLSDGLTITKSIALPICTSKS
jgi:hypothetical protein